ncbi:TPA: replication initiation protein [Staphylococcus aureus]|nr:replication initiation protein [Staphylococcus aureus]
MNRSSHKGVHTSTPTWGVPSWTALNPHTRGGHIVYALGAPVCLSNAGNRKPVNLLARVEAGLTRVLGGDPAFAGRITKNPECTTAHLPLWGRPKLSTT